MPIKWTPGRNGQILRKAPPTETEPGRNRKNIGLGYALVLG